MIDQSHFSRRTRNEYRRHDMPLPQVRRVRSTFPTIFASVMRADGSCTEVPLHLAAPVEGGECRDRACLEFAVGGKSGNDFRITGELPEHFHRRAASVVRAISLHVRGRWPRIEVTGAHNDLDQGREGARQREQSAIDCATCRA